MTNVVFGELPNQAPLNSHLGELAYQDRVAHGRLAITGTLALAKQHMGLVIDVTSGTFAITTEVASILRYGWWVIIRNSGTGVVTLPTADGVAYTLVTGQSRKLFTDGTSFYTLPMFGGLSLPLAVLTPTVAATVDALTTFTAAYDNYLIIGDGLIPSAADKLQMRFGSAGTSDTGNNYFTGVTDSTAFSTATSSFGLNAPSNALDTGRGINFIMNILNANSTTSIKTLSVDAVWQAGSTPDFNYHSSVSAYYPNNAVSGVRFFWTGGANFTAVGKIRIYGYNNAV